MKQIDTLAAEFPAQTNYLYTTYNGVEHDVAPCFSSSKDGEKSGRAGQDKFGSGGSPSLLFKPAPVDLPPSLETLTDGSSCGYPSPPDTTGPSRCGGRGPEPSLQVSPRSSQSGVVVLGCGPYRIGSSVEFDWCCVSCVRTIRKLGRAAVVINCNPETVSTDFDESDRLYFDELSHETVLEICEFEQPMGLVISVGGQTPNNLAVGLHKAGVKILGTKVEAIDAAENRYKFSNLCDRLRIDQPRWSQFTNIQEAFEFGRLVGYPVLVRPSYVLSGAAMRVVHGEDDLVRFLKSAAVVSQDHPVVISKYILNAKEVEMDAVACAGEVVNYAISEHVENAGVHSGDATLLLPVQKLYVETHRRVKKISQKICRALQISGPFNI